MTCNQNIQYASTHFLKQEQLANFCVNISHAYRQCCVRVPSYEYKPFPENLKLLPLYILVMLIYPRMMAVHTLFSEEADGSLTTPIIPLTSEHITEDGIFLLENGEDALIYIGDRVVFVHGSGPITPMSVSYSSFDLDGSCLVLTESLHFTDYESEYSYRI
ncbi:hypothetical protein KPL70_014047 [Citrus sinensis]|nr:hypothetical protein KPL70_014047 [Citrus sinensis]